MSSINKDWYPSQICSDCGKLANKLTCMKRYGAKFDEKKFKASFGISTMNMSSPCQICGRKVFVTELRDFFYPDVMVLRFMKRYFNNKE